jgi:hypothetical protein
MYRDDRLVTKTWDYNQVSQLYSDKIAQTVDQYLAGSPLRLNNKLPVEVHVFQESYRGKFNVGSIKPAESLFLRDDSISDGDVLHFLYKPQSSSSYSHICPSHSVTKRHGTILIGTVSSYTKTYRRDISPGGDVNSINVHNMLPWDLVVAIAGKPVMYVQKNRELNNPRYNGDITVSPSVYFDDIRRGVNIGTKFDIFANLEGNEPSVDLTKNKFLYSFVLNDIDQDRIIVGVVSPVIDQSRMTGINSKNSGKALYRLGNIDKVEPVFVPGERTFYAFNAKNGPGTDKKRATLGSNVRSTNPLARHKMLSGNNVITGPNIGM